MMAEVHEDLSRTHQVKASSNRGFGWVFVIVFVVIGCWPLLAANPPRWGWLTAAAVMLLVTLVAPALLALPNRLWMKFGALLHRIVSPVILGILFYGVVTPTGLLMRAFGMDKLRIRRGGTATSYWIERQPPGPKPESMNHQF